MVPALTPYLDRTCNIRKCRSFFPKLTPPSCLLFMSLYVAYDKTPVMHVVAPFDAQTLDRDFLVSIAPAARSSRVAVS